MSQALHGIEACDGGNEAKDEETGRDSGDDKGRRWRERRDTIRTVGSVIAALAAAYGALRGR